jgi:hypothetical protein
MGPYMLSSADGKRKINVSKKKVQRKTKGEEVIYQEAQAYLVLDSGA